MLNLNRTRTVVILIALALSAATAVAGPGDLDVTFGSGGKTTSPFDASFDVAGSVLVRNSGKIIVVGRVDSSKARLGLLRYSIDASLDTSFGSGGKVVVDFPIGGLYGEEAVIQPDGKILVAVIFSYGVEAIYGLARINIDGTLDTSFSSDGITLINFGEAANSAGSPDVFVQTDGKIVISGSIFSSGKMKFALARLNADGSPDTSFWAYGLKIYEESQDLIADAMTVDPNGRILVAGVKNDGNWSYGVVRIFDTNGYLITDHYFNWANWVLSDPYQVPKTRFSAIEIDGAGKVVVAGNARGSDGSQDFVAARFLADGNLDTSFNYAGYSVCPVTSLGHEAASSLAIQDDGKIVVGGVANGKIGLMKFTTAGLLDSTFGTNGIKTTDRGNNGAQDIAVGANNKIVVVANSDSVGEFLTLRYNSDGSLDSNFHPGVPRTSGWIETNFGAGDQYAWGAALQPDGKIITAVQRSDQLGEMRLVRYNSNGSLDTSFGVNGRRIIFGLCNTMQGPSRETSTSVAVQSDGKILVGGSVTGGCVSLDIDFLLVRLNPDGGLDTTFGTNGYVFVDFNGGDDISNAITMQDDGKIILAGISTASNETRSDFAVARFNTNGTLDTTFSSDGKAVISFGDFSAFANSVAVQPSHMGGRIVVAGYDTTLAMLQQQHDFAIARLNSNGTMDAQFGSAGRVTTQFGSLDSGISSIVLSGTKIVAVGNARNLATGADFAIARYNLNGTLDTTFDTDGKVTTSFGSFNDRASSVRVQADGKIVVGGVGHTSPETKDNFAVARYLTNGALDTTFSLDGKVTTSFSSYNAAMDSIRTILIQPDGKIVAFGNSFTGVNYDLAIARYQP